MTFFVGCIDLDQQTFTYASASHDPPYFMRKSGDKLVKKDLKPLNEVNGPRLGESKDFIYEDISFDFAPGDMCFLYTDGILDVQDAAGKKWGERTFLKTLVDNANSGATVEARLNGLKKTMNDFRNGSPLIDDVTMVLCEYQKVAA